MDADQEHEQFRALFSDLKRADERSAPPFERDWQAAIARSRQPRPAAFRIRRAAAIIVAATGIVAAVLTARSHREPTVARHETPTAPAPIPQHSPTQPTEIVTGPSVLDWESPTAFLLNDSENLRP